MNETVPLELRGVHHGFQSGDTRLELLRGADLSLHPGEIVALMAPSGTGKSTLLHLAGLLEQPQGGSVHILGRDAGGLSDTERTGLRRRAVGFVYQSHHLLVEFTARENVVLPQMIGGTSRRDARRHADTLLDRFGLAHRLDHLPGKLSGGEQQRVAIARALANSPRILLADEPTGNLDTATAEQVFAELLRAARSDGLAALIATHNADLARRMDRIVTLRQGLIVPLG